LVLINVIIIILLIAFLGILSFNTTVKGIITLSTVITVSFLSSYIAIIALLGDSYEVLFSGTELFGKVLVRIDSLSAWFILTINFTFITGALYGLTYMRRYRERKNDITLHCIAFLTAQFALLGISSVQNGFIFLLLWEMMAISMFITVIFEHEKPNTIKAGINYLVQSHISIVFMLLTKQEIIASMASQTFQMVNQLLQELHSFCVFL
jgi:hydrogenase-4 component B